MNKNVPNTLSISALILSCIAIFLSFYFNSVFAFSLILIATLLDMYDGYYARKYNIQSERGMHIDTAQDILNYVLFPFIVFGGGYFIRTFHFFHNSHYFILPLFIFCSLWRLKRFAKKGLVVKNSSYYYEGMPVFYNHIFVACFLLMPYGLKYFVIILGVPIISLLMISPIQFKKPSNIKFWSIVLIVSAVYFFIRGVLYIY